jgi:hypothetical protein
MAGGKRMTIKKIVDYVLLTPLNTNKNILTEMLNQLVREAQNGGSDTPENPEIDIIYDGGTER